MPTQSRQKLSARKWIYASFVANLSSENGLFRWAWRRTLRYIGTFPLLVLAPGILIILLGALTVPPQRAGASQRLLMGLLAFAAVVITAFSLTYVVALAIAVYQRYSLRRSLHYAKARIDATNLKMVDSADVERLRREAAELKTILDGGKPPWYGPDSIEYTRLCSNSFRKHFPELRLLLDILADEWTAINALTDRLLYAAMAAGMDQPPWLAVDFVPGIVSMTERRCATGFPASEPTFDWCESAGSFYWGEPRLGLRVLSSIGPDEDLAGYKRTFEDFVRNAQSWPEFANITMSSDVLHTIEDSVTRQLGAIVLTENFTNNVVRG